MPNGSALVDQEARRRRRERRGARRRAAAGPLGPTGPQRGASFPFGFGLPGSFSLRGAAIRLLEGGLTIVVPFDFFSRRRNQTELPPGALSQAQPLPIPTPPTPPGGLERVFGELGKAANDPVFRRTAGTRFGLFGLAGAILIAGEVALINEILRRQQERIDRELEEQEREIEEINRRAQRQRELEAIRRASADPLPDIPDFPRVPRPDAPPSIPRQPVFLPDIVPVPSLPGGTPAPSAPGEPAAPSIPAPGPLPAPSAPPAGLPLPTPAPLPSVVPSLFPSVIPFFEPFSPLNPLPDQLPVSSPLTGVRPSSVPSLGASFAPNPAALGQQAQTDKCPARRCDDDLEEPRDRCFKGLYREGPLETDFTSWVEIDCLTGKETGPADNVIDLDFPEPSI